MISNYMNSRIRHRLIETPTSPSPAAAPSGAGANVDKLFYGAREHLQQAQKQLHDLLQLLQNGHQGVDSAPVADCYKATAESIDTMDQLARKWQEQAQKTQHVGEGFDHRPYVRDRLYFEKGRSLTDLQETITFDFERFMVGDDE